MKRLLSILTSVAFTTSLMANNSIIVNTTQNLVNAVSTVKPGDTILIADGTYRNLRLSVTTDGTSDKIITIKAQNPGKAYISGNSAIELRGDYIHLSGLYFKDGSRNPGEWKTHGPGIVSIYADHCEVSECLFYDFEPGKFIIYFYQSRRIRSRTAILPHTPLRIHRQDNTGPGNKS